jgi:hypothetical protein
MEEELKRKLGLASHQKKESVSSTSSSDHERPLYPDSMSEKPLSKLNIIHIGTSTDMINIGIVESKVHICYHARCLGAETRQACEPV